MSDDSTPVPAPEGQNSLEAARQEALAGTAAMLETIRQGRLLPALPEGETPDWDLHESRLHALEEIIRTGSGPADVVRYDELHLTYQLDFDADIARVQAGLQERMVRFLDDISARTEEKKFELASETRYELEEMLAPYHEKYREKMLRELPIEKRRELEAEAARRRETGEPPAK